METLNDVMDYADYFFGKDEPPVFHHEHFDLQKKQFVPVDDYSLCSKLNLNSKEDVILHYFVRDICQIKMKMPTKMLSSKRKTILISLFSDRIEILWYLF